MAYETKIEWAQSTWNPITGCSRVSKGCEHCYAERLAAGRLRHHPSRSGLTDEHGRWNGVVRFNEKWLDQPLRWRKPRRIFVCAHSDLFHEHVPDEWIDRVFAVMAMCPQHVFQVLTKRPARMRDYLTNGMRERLLEGARPPDFDFWYGGLPLPNVWLGTSSEDQATADERIPHLMGAPAAVRWISAEPLLGPIDFSPWMGDNPVHEANRDRRDSTQRSSKWANPGTARRVDMEDRPTQEKPMGWDSSHQEGHPSSNRQDPVEGVQACQVDGQLEADINASTPTGLENVERPDTGWPHDQSQERTQVGQQTLEPGAGHSFRATDSLGSCSEDSEVRKPVRGAQSCCEANRGSGERNQKPEGSGGAAGVHSGGLQDRIPNSIENRPQRKAISWLICGGESGPGYRPMDPDWARSIRDQCIRAGVACFIKQMAGKVAIPADLMIREYPS